MGRSIPWGTLSPNPWIGTLVFLQGHFDSSITKLQSWFWKLRRWTRCEKKTHALYRTRLCVSKAWGAMGFNHKNFAANLFFALCTMAQWPNDLWANLCRVSSWNFVAFSRCFFFAKTLPTRDFFGGAPKDLIKWTKKSGVFFVWLRFKKNGCFLHDSKYMSPFFLCVFVCSTLVPKKKKNLEGGSGAPAICW